MKNNRPISIITILLFCFTLFLGAFSPLYSQSLLESQVSQDSQDSAIAQENNQTGSSNNEISRLLKVAEKNYRDGNFKMAIDIYESIISRLKLKKELLQSKQKLLQTMISLALTRFTVQENDKALAQLEKLLLLSPKHVLVPDLYPPKFLELFKNAQRKMLGTLMISSTPSGATVFCDGVPVGKSPYKNDSILGGVHAFKIVLNGFLPVEKSITVTPGTPGMESITLVAADAAIAESKKTLPAVKGVLVKSAPKKKKKKFSPLLLVGGVALVVLAVLLSKKKDSETVAQAYELPFTNNLTKEITASTAGSTTTYSLNTVSGIPVGASIQKIEYRVAFSHDSPGDLRVVFRSPDEAFFTIKENSSTDAGPLTGSTMEFNTVVPNGNWALIFHNRGRLAGSLESWFIKIYYRY
ncbi:MAG: PEGA domain-containing protein [bacterium]|nr:PEGA domain-containing protein [bacterium]